MNVSLTYFDINFENRLGTTPLGGTQSFEVLYAAFENPDAFPPGTVIFNPSQDEISALLASADQVNALLGADPTDADVLVFASVVRNLSTTLTSRFDFGTNYTFKGDVGDLHFGVSGTYLSNFEQRAASTTPVVSQLNTQYNPVDLRLRSNIGYSKDGFSGNLFVNYTDSYKVDNEPSSAKIDSWTTVDLNLAYNTGRSQNGSLLSDTVFRLSVINLFDENPPETPSFPAAGIFGYDPTNASPLNRFVAFEINKRF